MLDESGLMEELRGLVTCAAQDQRAAGVFQAITQRFQRMQTGRVDRRHIPQPQDDDGRKRR
jgi:hypothetical protein